MNYDAHNLPAKSETDHLMEAASADSGFEKLLKYKRPRYYCDGEEVKMGTQFVAHCVGWTKCWVKFRDGEMKERHLYRVSTNERVPAREELDDNVESEWEIGPQSGRPSDPWVYQYLLPLQNPESGEVVYFVTHSQGGKRAVADLVAEYGRRRNRTGQGNQPIIALDEGVLKSPRYGDVPRPYFRVIDWEAGAKEPIREINAGTIKKDDMDDDIPF